MVVAGEWQCDEGVARGDLGISGLDCRGECTLTMNEKGEEQAWSFTVEPRISGIARGGPADGVLRVDDVLVAIDGLLITTREGGLRYAGIKPGEEVSVRFRRDGRLATVPIRAGSTCPPPPPKVPSPPAGVSVGDPFLPPGRSPWAGSPCPSLRTRSAGHPASGAQGRGYRGGSKGQGDHGLRYGGRTRGREGPADPGCGSPDRPDRPARPGVPEGRLGISFSCSSECTGTTRDGVRVWEFSGPIEVIGLDPGGPADLAHIQLGDQITAINGSRIESQEGGEEFSLMAPDEPVELTVVKRNGQEETVTVVPVTAEVLARDRRLLSNADEFMRESARVTGRAVPPSRSAGSERPSVPAPPAGITAPEGMPLRYSGTVEGVEVEVRGNPVTVSEMRGERTILINADGVWIRITIPREGE